MDFITKEVVRILDYNGEYDLEFNSNSKNFANYSNASYVIYDASQYKKLESKNKRQVVNPIDKEKCKASIACIEFSHNSKYLMACYQNLNSIIIWDIVECKQIHKLTVEDITLCKLCPYNPHVILCSGNRPSIINLLTQERVYFFIDSQAVIKYNGVVLLEDNKKKQGKDWLVSPYYYNNDYYFFLVSSLNEVLLLKEKSKTSLASHIIENVNECKFETIAYDFISFNGAVTAISTDQKQKSAILLCSDRYLRIIDILYETRAFNLQKEIVDIVNKKKWTSASFFSVFGNEDYIVAGLGEYGNHEIQFMVKATGQVYRKLSEYHEGCIHIATHTQAHESIVVVTSSGDLYLWSVKNPKGWSALAPGFTEVEENFEYIEKEDEHDYCEATNTKESKKKSKAFKFLNEVQAISKKYRSVACFDTPYEYVEEDLVKSIPARLCEDSLSEKGISTLKKLKEYASQRNQISHKEEQHA